LSSKVKQPPWPRHNLSSARDCGRKMAKFFDGCVLVHLGVCRLCPKGLLEVVRHTLVRHLNWLGGGPYLSLLMILAADDLAAGL
jgi:hypothetical protein